MSKYKQIIEHSSNLENTLLITNPRTENNSLGYSVWVEQKTKFMICIQRFGFRNRGVVNITDYDIIRFLSSLYQFYMTEKFNDSISFYLNNEHLVICGKDYLTIYRKNTDKAYVLKLIKKEVIKKFITMLIAMFPSMTLESLNEPNNL
jgi:hypothetical protein